MVAASASIRERGEGAHVEVETQLRLGVAAGRVSHAILDAWSDLPSFADRDPEGLADILGAASGPQSMIATGAIVESQALGLAVLDRQGRLSWCDDAFRAWIGDPAGCADAVALARRATLERRAAGRIGTLRHGVLAALALAGPEANAWATLRPDDRPAWSEREVLLVVFAPSRALGLIERAAEALKLSPLQRRIVTAMLDAPTVEAAALSLGVGRETARDALDGALRKAGVRRAAQLVGRLIELSCGLNEAPAAQVVAAGAALGLTRVETQVAAHVARGDTTGQAARALGLTTGTVRAYRRAIFEKLGIHRCQDLSRLMTEAGELGRLSAQSQVSRLTSGVGDLRIFNAAGGRTVACLDYGPPGGRPVLLMHGMSTGRMAPPPLLAALASKGCRVIVPQRPGYGLTTVAANDHLAEAVADMALILDRLGCRDTAVLARDTGSAVALVFASRYPARIGSGLLLNPRAPVDVARRRKTLLTALGGMLLRHPRLIDPYGRMLLSQTSPALLEGLFRRVFATADADRDFFEQPEIPAFLIADLMGLVGRTISGAAAEQRLHSEGWCVPAPYIGPKWRLAFSGRFYSPGDETDWATVSVGAPTILPRAGLAAQFTHAEAIAALLAD